MVFREYALTPYKVPTVSMMPALWPGDFIFANRWAYGSPLDFLGTLWKGASPQRGDLVVYLAPRNKIPFVKRIVGLPGETLRGDGEALWINNSKLSYEKVQISLPHIDPELFSVLREQSEEASYLILLRGESQSRLKFDSVQIPVDHYFLMGDNRDISEDSRQWGSVPKGAIVSRVERIWFSWELGGGPRWERVMKSPRPR